MKISNAEVGDSIFMACGKKNEVENILSLAREKIADELKLIDYNTFAFCWIVDHPMFEEDEKTKKIIFSHNPFSMPQGDIKKLDLSKPLEINDPREGSVIGTPTPRKLNVASIEIE